MIEKLKKCLAHKKIQNELTFYLVFSAILIRCPFSNTNGRTGGRTRLVSVGKGSARAEVEIKEHHLNGLDIAHGGVIFTLADMAFAAASNSYGVDAVAVNVSISFFKAVQKGKLFSEATEISRNRKLATYRIDVTDEAGELIASHAGDRLPENISKIIKPAQSVTSPFQFI